MSALSDALSKAADASPEEGEPADEDKMQMQYARQCMSAIKSGDAAAFLKCLGRLQVLMGDHEEPDEDDEAGNY